VTARLNGLIWTRVQSWVQQQLELLAPDMAGSLEAVSRSKLNCGMSMRIAAQHCWVHWCQWLPDLALSDPFGLTCWYSALSQHSGQRD